MSESPEAWSLKLYESDKFSVKMTAFDRIHSNGDIPPEHWMRFKVTTMNILRTDFEGRALAEAKYVVDTDASGTYRTLDEAKTAYEVFLARYTDCKFSSDTGRFEEHGNKLSPDIPKVVADSPKAKVTDFGSW